MKDVEIKQLKYFVTVAEELHFGRAALKLSITQPALSQQIAKLEEELGAQLLNRDRRSVSLTDAGREFLEKITKILSELDAVYESTQEQSTTKNFTVRLAQLEYARYPFTVPAINELRKLYPEVQIENHNMHPDQIVLSLLQNEIDVGLSLKAKMLDSQTQINYKRLIKSNWLALVSKEHPLAKRQSLDLKDIVRERIIFIPPEANPHFYEDVVNAFEKAGSRPNIVYTSTQSDLNKSMAAQNFGIALGTTTVYKPVEDKEIVFIPLTGLPDLDIYVYWRKQETSGLILDFTEFIIEQAAKLI